MNKLYNLNYIRIVSAEVILSYHVAQSYNFDFNLEFIEIFINNGAILMTMFFLLSGFVIYYKYEELSHMNKQSIICFYKNRLLSIMPTYLIFNILYLLWNKELLNFIFLFPIETLGLQSILPDFFNIYHFSGTWFVSCIIICYFIYPLIALCVPKELKKLIFVLLGLYIVSFYLPGVSALYQVDGIYANPIFRVLEFSIGVVAAKIFVLHSAKFENKHNGIIFLFALISFFVSVFILSKIEKIRGYFTLYNILLVPIYIIIIFTLGKAKNKFKSIC